MRQKQAMINAITDQMNTAEHDKDGYQRNNQIIVYHLVKTFFQKRKYKPYKT